MATEPFGERWTCPRCGRSFALRNQTHACHAGDPPALERHLVGRTAPVVETFWAVVDAARVRPARGGAREVARRPPGADELRSVHPETAVARRPRRARPAARVAALSPHRDVLAAQPPPR